MDKMIAEMTDSGAKQQATMHLNMSKAEMKNGNEVGCLAHMQEAHKVRWACSLGLALNAGCGKAMPTRAQARVIIGAAATCRARELLDQGLRFCEASPTELWCTLPARHVDNRGM